MLSAPSQKEKSRPPLRLVSHEERPGLAPQGVIPSLFGIRGFSALIIILCHVSSSRMEEPYATFFSHFHGLIPGPLSVRVFFVVSGFIITLTLLREEARNHGVSLKHFYIRRFCRLAPVALLFLAIVPLLGINRGEVNPMAGWWTALTYTQAIARDIFVPAWSWQHYWSLSVEEFFYLAWPITFVAFSKRRRLAVLVGTILLVPLIRAFCQGFGKFPGFTIFSHLDLMATGCLTAILFFRYEFQMRPFFESHHRKIVIASFATVTLIFWSEYTLRWALFRVPFGYSVEAVAIALTILSVTLNEKGALYRFLNWKPLAAIGVMSYSLYIWQQAFTSYITAYVPGAPMVWWRSFPLNLLLMFPVAYLSYRLFEKPFQALGHKLTTKSK